MDKQQKTGWPATFLVLWGGQVISIFGSTLTGFALGVWTFQQTGSVTRFALISFFTLLPGVLLLPLMGVIVDRFDRRQVMIVSDVGAALGTLMIAALLWLERLEIWQIYILLSWISTCNAPQVLAFNASIPLIVDKRYLTRANGLYLLGAGLAEIGAPLLAGFLVLEVSLWSIVLIDVATFLIAAATLLLIRLPSPVGETGRDDRSEADAGASRLAAGFEYLRTHRGLLGLMVYFTALNFNRGAVLVLITPLVLSMASAAALGVVHALGAAGMVMGALLMTVWKQPRRSLPGIYAATAFYGAVLFVGGLRPNVALVGGAAFLLLIASPISNSLSLAIWQRKVPLNLQGRVFATRRMVISAATPLAQLLAGPVSDHLFEPWMAEQGALAAKLGPIFGVGPGRGVAVLMTLLGVVALVNALVGYLYLPLRQLESEIPDAAGLVAPRGLGAADGEMAGAVVAEPAETQGSGPKAR